jgi:hypothetical protein
METAIDECMKTINDNRAQLQQVLSDYSSISKYLQEKENVRKIIKGDLNIEEDTELRGIIRCLCRKNRDMNLKYSQIKNEVVQWFG